MLLKVSVVEMERNIIKQFGVDLNALINSGNFAFAALSDLPFPINVAGKGLLAPFLPRPMHGIRPWPSGTPPLSSTHGHRRLRRAMDRPGRTACRACCARLSRMACCTLWPSRT